jgi:hypothetical protein
MRHAAIAQALLPLALPLATLGSALVLPPCLALPKPVAQLPTARTAVALAPVIPETHGEWLVALEASDLDEVERVSAGHAAGKADLDNSSGEWEALSVTRSSFHLAASTAWPSARAAGRFHLAAHERSPSQMDPGALRSLRSLTLRGQPSSCGLASPSLRLHTCSDSAPCGREDTDAPSAGSLRPGPTPPCEPPGAEKGDRLRGSPGSQRSEAEALNTPRLPARLTMTSRVRPHTRWTVLSVSPSVGSRRYAEREPTGPAVSSAQPG